MLWHIYTEFKTFFCVPIEKLHLADFFTQPAVVMVVTRFKYLLWLKLQYIRQERNFDIQNVSLKNAQVCEGTPSKLASVNSHREKMTLPPPNNATHQSKTHHVMKV